MTNKNSIKLLIPAISILFITCNQPTKVDKPTPKFEPALNYEQASAKADSILNQLTLDEKIELIGGHNFFFVKGLEQFNIPQLYLSDATQGVHLRKDLDGQLDKTVAFPCPILLASTWNTNLAYKYAQCIGEECRAGGIEVLLGPGMNIYRVSQNGRNFEYFGEDPFLAARFIENYVVGVQNTGTIATLKHFLANNTDHYRRNSNSVVDLRTLHEIYLPAFKAGIDAGAMAIMTSYNQVNGEWAGQSNWAINDLLRKQLGFKWLVMSDWWSTWDPVKTIKSGLDLEMPGHALPDMKYFDKIGDIFVRSNAKKLIDEQKVDEADINRMARNIIAVSIAMGFNKRDQLDTTYLQKFTEHEQVALQTAREGIVLLKNDNNILPIDKNTNGSILLTGMFVEQVPMGGGSAAVDGYNHVTMLKALQNEFGNKIEYSQKPTNEQVKNAQVVILSIGTLDSEAWDTPFDLPATVVSMVENIAQQNKNIVLIVNSGGGRNLTQLQNKVAAIIYSWYPGQNGFMALAEIIAGTTNPSGKLPITIEQQFSQSPGYGYMPADKPFYTGWDPDFNMSLPIYDINYTEGIMVGYRWYMHKNIEPLYWFGHGLSYTNFSFNNLKTKVDGNGQQTKVIVEFIIKNTGKYKGAEVAQVYVTAGQSSVIRPERELKGFEKVELEVGEGKKVQIVLNAADFMFYCQKSQSWVLEPGKFTISVGNSVNNIILKSTVSIN